ncbi:MAG: HAD family hydrolase [Pirellulaceae bacterium]
MSFATTVILFDIDGTLVRASGYQRSPMELAAFDVFGVESIPKVELGGRTDFAIFGEVVEKLGFDYSVHRTAFEEAYYRHLDNAWASGCFREMPGMKTVLKELSQRSVPLGLITGNAEPAARIKLSSAGMWDHFGFGGFGRDHEHRNDVALLALDEVKVRYRHWGDNLRVLVIGDTPADIECARHIGAQVVAVATGGCSLAELEKSKPDLLFADFSEPEKRLDEITQILARGTNVL